MSRWITLSMVAVAVALAATFLMRSVAAQQVEWPLELDDQGMHIVLYQPQPESLQGDKLSARAAVSVERAGDSEPKFGAIWLEARVSTDRDARTVTALDVKVPRVKFSDTNAELDAALAKVVQDELSKQRHTYSLDKLLTTLEAADATGGPADLRHVAPRIVVAKEPTVLVSLDGEPKMSAIDGSRVMRVVNTPFVMLFDPPNKTYYLRTGDTWAKAGSIEGPWLAEPAPPSEVTSALPPPQVETDAAADVPKSSAPARILVATEPTELVVCDGEPQWSPLAGNDLLFLTNTNSDVFMLVRTQHVFVLLAGRWFESASLDKGPWTYVPADKLPEEFARIPPNSAKRSVRSFVGGTDEAREALLDATIPQTSIVQRSEAHCVVTYDGAPRFEPIAGSPLRYAVNTNSSVLEFGGKFYCCSEAVWFVADSALGPWIVCTAVPKEVYSIPPSCPIYPVRYVYVYDSTPEVVYVGYLPGYVGCYVAGPTIVYGTGYFYPGWYGASYYAWPHTYGYCPHYDPWTCDWTLGFSSGWAASPFWFQASFGFGHTGWWGPCGFSGHHFDVHEHHVHVHPKTNPWFDDGRDNIYRRPENVRRNLADLHAGPAAQRTRTSGSPSNDVYVDRDGRVLRRTNDGWQERRADGWKAAESTHADGVAPSFERSGAPLPGEPATRRELNPPGAIPPRENPSRATPPSVPPRDDFERMHRAREQGAARARELERSRPQPAAPPARGKPRG